MTALHSKRIFIAGHQGMVGSALTRRLASENCTLITATRQELDLCDSGAVERWVQNARPDIVVIAAGKVGGIMANDAYPVEFLNENLQICGNLINSAYRAGVAKLLYLGSSCIYPRLAPQPIPESALLTGPLEPTNAWYAVAKIAGIKLCQAYRKQHGCDYISVMPTNLYGPGDNYALASGHVLPALMRKIRDAMLAGAPTVEVWGSGRPLREFMHVDDLADACVFLLKTYSQDEHINVGSGQEVSIGELARTIAEVVGFPGDIVFDPGKPDGMPRKLLDSSKLTALGWSSARSLKTGIAHAYAAYLQEEAAGAARLGA